MAAVKGSKQLRMVVVPYRPGFVWGLRLGLLGLALIGIAAAYFGGRYFAFKDSGDARAERDVLQQQVAVLQNDNAALQQQILNLEQTASVDKEALNSVQRTILNLREQISQLQEDVLFYKQIMSPENEETGLVIGQLDLVKADGSAAIMYKLELKQQGNNENVISGHVNVNVLGQQDGQEVSIPLRSLSPQIADLDIRLQFRYFQNIEGEMNLPDDFEPQKIQILAVAEGANAKTVQKSFGWLVQN